ncbi:MAG: 4-diphosphocytidyl-2C-methyl-D-erythritol synthase [Sphingopyxis sp.]|nr:4-diphosphocytidyl-2C-methyl-D-erythritol synthase [Sphingopyxis sp.]
MTIPAIVMAGSRPGPDPLLSGTNVSTKALLPIAGQAMLVHVVRALRASPQVGAITILAQNSAELAADPGLAGVAGLHFADSGQGISSSLAAALPPGDDPVLVTTADNVLLTPSMIDEFLTGADGSDVAVAMVERAVLLSRYPQSKRTWLKFRGGWWSGANLFRLRGRRVLPLLDFWGRIERDRKKGRKIVAAFGPFLLVGALLRLFTIQQGVARAGLRFGLKARVVSMSEAEACIDADKPVDIELIEQIFASRQAAASALSTAATASASSSS